MRTGPRLALALISALTFTACGPDRPATIPVEGRVTWEGKPVGRGTITFQPTSGRAAFGQLDADGHYRLSTFADGDGAIAGHHQVTIEATALTESSPAPTSMDDELKRVQAGGSGRPTATTRWLVPETYAHEETSPLSADVSADTTTIDFALPNP